MTSPTVTPAITSILPTGRVVVQLSALNLRWDQMIGLKVYHPMQQDFIPHWTSASVPLDSPGYDPTDKWDWWDEGRVTEVYEQEHGGWTSIEARFEWTSDDPTQGLLTHGLHYSLNNLWVGLENK